MNTYKKMLSVSMAVAISAIPIASQAGKANSGFEAPVELKANGSSINRVSYPSPTLYDLDGDGKRELVIGEIFGSIHAGSLAEDKLNWGELGQVNNTNGEPLKLNNW